MLYLKKFIKAILPYGIVMLIMKNKKKRFPGSAVYWEDRYKRGDNSGAGSYNELANFKAKVINNFVKNNNIKTVIEFGCGDGNQLSLALYPKYTGFDVSKTAINLCRKIFKNDPTKTFLLLKKYNDFHRADIVISLDVIYHLIEDIVFEKHINQLFQAATKFVIIYAYDFEGDNKYHVKHRNFTKYINQNIKNWNLLEHIPNEYPYNKNEPDNTSWSDFYIYSKVLSEQ